MIGIGVVGAPVALDLRRSAQSRPLLGDLSAADLVAAEEAYLGTQVRALMVRLAEKDAYTEEHTRRVALRAVQIGEELGLSPARLRVLALGGLLHDMGKLAVPDAILTKPAALTDEEYGVIKHHPESGERLLAELGFAPEVRRLVLDHHEWSHEDAVALLRDRAGVEFGRASWPRSSVCWRARRAAPGRTGRRRRLTGGVAARSAERRERPVQPLAGRQHAREEIPVPVDPLAHGVHRERRRV